jgi:retron-type reverse transcriptase
LAIGATGDRRTPVNQPSKPFNIDKRRVYEAYLLVRSNGGAAGVDGITIEQFEADLKSNLYKIWNRMSSGAYLPPPVRAVSIPRVEANGSSGYPLWQTAWRRRSSNK